VPIAAGACALAARTAYDKIFKLVERIACLLQPIVAVQKVRIVAAANSSCGILNQSHIGSIGS
jgi:hypothetical protein